MRQIAIFLLIITLFPLSVSSRNQLIMEQKPSIQQKTNEDDQTIRWDYFSAVSGVVGLGIAFIPYLSLLGILLGAAAVVFSVFAFRKKQKKRWAWLGMITGGLTMVAFLAVIGLLTFF